MVLDLVGAQSHRHSRAAALRLDSDQEGKAGSMPNQAGHATRQSALRAGFVVVAVLAACSRSGLLQETTETSTPTPSAGGAPTVAGTGGSSARAGQSRQDTDPPPQDAGVAAHGGTAAGSSSTVDASSDAGSGPDASIASPIAGCAVPVAPISPRSRWLAFPSRYGANSWFTTFLVWVGPDGPGTPYALRTTQGGVSIGTWSDDGRFFGLNEYDSTAANPGYFYPIGVRVYRVSDSGDAPELVYSSDSPGQSEHFWGWFPKTSLFYTVGQVYTAGQPELVLDAANPAAGPRAISGPNLGGWSASPAGRYATYSSSPTPSSGWLADTSTDPVTLTKLVDGDISGAHWSPAGTRAEFCGGANNQMLLVSTEDPSAPKVTVTDYDCALIAYDRVQWASENLLIWIDKDLRINFIDASAAAPKAVTLADKVVDFAWPSPGGRCVAYSGHCPGSNANGICVRSLPPDAAAPAVLVARTGQYFRWSRGGSRLLIAPEFGSDLWDVDLAGTTSSTRSPTAGLGLRDIFSAEYDSFEPPFWVGYTSQDIRFKSATLFWNPAKAATVAGAQDAEIDATWSPDGTNYVSYRANVVGGLLVQHVTPGALGPLWSVPGITLPPLLPYRPFIWQP
jgi:hypothetical protein